MNDESEEELIEKVNVLDKELVAQSERLENLLDYLIRIDPNFKFDPMEFESWETRLSDLKFEDARVKKIRQAADLLKTEGYIVAADENEIDAERLKKWIGPRT